jgi:hypothetical protein
MGRRQRMAGEISFVEKKCSPFIGISNKVYIFAM